MSKLKMLNDNGVTLVEVVVTCAVLIILVASLAFSYQGWIAKYRVESQIKEMYIDFMNARARSMERNRVHFASLPSGTAYSIYEDTNTVPDGNGTLETGSDTRLPTFPKTVTYPVTWTGGGTTIAFGRNGMISPSGDMFITATADVDYDCMTITAMKINMGKKNGSVCEIK
jgi:Tfp pilus assembly protein FimT